MQDIYTVCITIQRKYYPPTPFSKNKIVCTFKAKNVMQENMRYKLLLG